MQPLTLTAYAKLRGVSVVSVSKAVARGRLDASVGRDDRGRPTIVDQVLADQEWEANTRHRVDRPDPRPALLPVRVDAPAARAAAVDSDVPNYNVSRALRAAAAARREAALASSAELDLAERRGELVPTDAARAAVIDRYTLVKTRLLSVPSRVAQRLPHVASEVVPVIDAAIREALEELAEGERGG